MRTVLHESLLDLGNLERIDLDFTPHMTHDDLFFRVSVIDFETKRIADLVARHGGKQFREVVGVEGADGVEQGSLVDEFQVGQRLQSRLRHGIALGKNT